MVVGDKRNGLRAVFVAFLAVLTCVHSYTTTERITTQTQTAMQTTSITDKITTMPITVKPPPDSVCDSNWNCSQTEYCELRSPNVSGSCESCHDSCGRCSGPENKDCTSCNISSFIVQDVVYDSEATTPIGTNTTEQTTAETAATVGPTTVIATLSRTLTFGLTTTSQSPDVTDNATSSSTHPNATSATATSSTEKPITEPAGYSIKLECVDECPSDLEPPWSNSKLCCHVQCKDKGCYGSSGSSCCHDKCTTGCYGDGSERCCHENCNPDYGCDHNGQCRVITSTKGIVLLPWHWALIGTGGGIVVTGGIIGIICCCIRRRRREPREETDEGEENIGMKKRKSKKRKRNSYVPGPNSVRNPEMNQDGPYANEEYVDHAGLANPAHQQDDAYDDVNVNADVYVEPQPDQFNPGSTDDDIYDQPPLEELNHHQGAANYGYHDDALAQQDAVYGNDPNQFSGDQYPVSGDQYPVSGDQYPVSGDQYPVSGDQYPVSDDQYPVSGDQYPVSGDQYPASGDAGQSGFETAEPVYQNTGFAAQSNVTQEDPSMYQNFEESNPQPLSHEDPHLYYDYTAQHDPVHDFPPPPDCDDEQFPSIASMDSMPSLDPPPAPEDTPSHFQTSQLPPSLPPADLPSLPPPPPPTQTPLTQSPHHTASPHGTAGGRKKTRKVPPPPPAGPRPESARRAQRPPRVQVRNRRQQEPAAEIYGYENDQSEVYGYDN
ncbi:uncharacterized protein LOC118404032 isoform X2 [Branchiostoma floridae]|uniref:Uncharacterized protein LOC118404032 isoform X2 n=1 Tax=Branchiostoma floridae TaxID=7739 RepID=A0A9J7HI81_BRAFL|nr:uncharacterized protein LOC118404032 isoform X2 [Branchiostoma floridae]